MSKISRCLLPLLVLLAFSSRAQQSEMSLKECEELFQKKNMLLLSQQLGLDLAEAQIIQAKIWPQPVLSGELNAINPDAKRYFDVGPTGQKAFAIEELIRLGGKRQSEIALARETKEMARLTFEELLRNLRFELRTIYYTASVERENQETMKRQLNQIDTLLFAYKIQSNKGNLSQRDLVRLNSLQLQVKSELLASYQRLLGAQQQLALLTGSGILISPTLTTSSLNQELTQKLLPETSELLQQALSANYSLLKSKQSVVIAKQVERVELANRIPDLSLGAAYDQRGGAFNHQVNLTFSIPLPLWNSNKGNIQRSQIEVKQSEMEKSFVEQSLESELKTEVMLFNTYKNQLLTVSNQDPNTTEQVFNGIVKNFKAGNIELIEFTDFMESYNQSVLLTNNLTLQTIISFEKIKLISASDSL